MRSICLKNTVLILGFALLAACSSDGCGCDGFEQRPFPASSYDQTIASGGQARVTKAGLSFIEAQVPYLLDQFLPGGLSFCIPRDTSGNPSICVADTCTGGQEGCQVDLTFDGATLTPVPSRQLRANITIGGVDESLSFDYRVLGVTIRCEVKLHKAGQADTVAARVSAQIPVDLSVDATSPLRELQMSIGDIVLDLDDVDFKIRGRQNLGDTVACGGASLVRGLFRGYIETEIDKVLNETAQGFADAYLCRACGSGQPPCSSGSTCRDGYCMVGSSDACVPAPLGIEGNLNLGSLLGDFSLSPNASVAMLAKAGDHATVDTGVSVGLRSGFAPLQQPRCVPLEAHPRPRAVAVPRSATINADTKPNSTNTFMLGIGLHKSIIEHMLWSTWASGAVCLEISSADVELLSTATFGAILPSIRELAGGTPRDAFIHMVPQKPPTVTLGANTIAASGNTYTIVEPLLTIDWSDLDIHVFGFVQDRFTRLFTLRVDILLPIAVAPDGMGGISPVMDDLDKAIRNVRPLRSELIVEDPQRLIQLLPVVLGVALPSIAALVTQSVQLPEFLGFRLVLEQSDITSVDNASFIALFANFARGTSPLQAALQPIVLATRVDAARVLESGMPRPMVELDVLALERGWQSAPELSVEYSFRVDEGLWSLYQRTSTLAIEHPVLALQGEHRIEVRARYVGDLHSTSAIVSETPIVIDYQAPSLSLERDGALVRFVGEDVVDHALEYRYRLVGTAQAEAAWSSWTRQDFVEARALEQSATLEVEVRDRAGYISAASLRIVPAKSTRPGATDEPRAAAGCQNVGATPSGNALMFGVLLAGLWALRRRRLAASALLIALAAGGCDCGGELAVTSPPHLQCIYDLECAELCAFGQTGYCEHGRCQCASHCPQGCGEGEFCCFSTNACEAIGDLCGNEPCPPGFEFRAATVTPNRETCAIESFSCECGPLPPIPIGIHGPFADIASNGTTLAVSVYNRTYRDLMVATVEDSGQLQWYFVDGAPDDGEVVADPGGLRGGVIERGPNVGTHTAIAVDALGGLHVLYRDEDAKALKYARGVLQGGGVYAFETTTLDASTNAGFWSDLAVIDQTVHGVYGVREGSATEWSSQLRHISFSTTAPLAQIVVVPVVIASSESCAPACTDRGYPGATGLYNTLQKTSDGLLVVFYDHSKGRIGRARFASGQWEQPTMLAVGTGPYAAGAIDASGLLHLAFMNRTGLRHLQTGVGSPRAAAIHEGVRQAAHGYYAGLIGENVSLQIAADGRVVVSFHDAFDHALYVGVLEDEAWSVQKLAPQAKQPGSHGFYSGLTVHGSGLAIVEFVIDNQASPPQARAVVHRLP
ncbi:MAG: hypothetical protein H0U74_11105 [Bradymonadaceae bacterium]|nr:hypothetical protein [Lujinxingiaceae bacterium]